jgi:hypothetical protein
LVGSLLLALLSFVLALQSFDAVDTNRPASASTTAAVFDAIHLQGQAAYTAAVRVANDLRVVWEIRALMNSRQAEAAPPAPTILDRSTKACSRG